MNRHVQNLERLCQKLQARYGEQDPLVLQLKEEMTQLRGKLTTTRHWAATSYQRCFERRAARRATA